MEQRGPIYLIAAIGAVLTAIGTFSKSWFTYATADASAKIGLSGGRTCLNGECQPVRLGDLDPNWGYVGVAAILACVVSLGVIGYAMYLVQQGRAGNIDPKKLCIPPGAGAAASIAFLFIKPKQVHSTVSWAPFVAIVGFGVLAGVIWLAKWWLGDAAPRRPLPPGWNPNAQPGGWQQPPMQAQPMQPMQPGGYAPPQAQGGGGYGGQIQPQGGYAPPQQPIGQGGYGAPVRPIQAVQPLQPVAPAAPPPPQPDYAPPARPANTYGAPPQGYQPMHQQQSTTIPPGSNPCPKCATGLAYSSQYGKWYCARCREYL